MFKFGAKAQLAFLCLFMVVSATALPALAGAPDVKTVTVNGDAVISAAPTSATMTITISNTNTDAVTATAQVNANLAVVKNSLLALGISAKCIKTSDLSMVANFDRDYASITSYKVTHTLSVVVADIDKLGTVFDTVVAAGATSIQGIDYNIADRDRLQEQALQTAVQDARRKAAALAGIPQSNLTIVSIEDKSVATSRDTYNGFGGSGGFGWYEEPATEVMVNAINITAKVLVVFAF